MCGITGYVGGSPDRAVVDRMALQIQSRGPDDAGVWMDEVAEVALAHRRLAILDLSAAGHQPMVAQNGNHVLVYNGEIYNHSELRSEMEKESGSYNWRGHSDTETLLAALCHWGLQGALQRLNGMFAFALWDVNERTLFLARDRMGVKPLYYGRSNGIFLFGSELKALAAHPRWVGQVNRDAIALYLRHNYIPSPYCIYTGISKLAPAHFVAIRDRGRLVGKQTCYWDLESIAERGISSEKRDVDSWLDELDPLLRDAVRRRMLADVPLGAFLSGGIDSSMIVALMQAQSSKPVKTFSIGFIEEQYDEARYARQVATHLGTDHTELNVSARDAIAIIPRLPHIYDEPFADSSQIPTFLVSRLAKTSVTVSLSGDGGDELFGGYTRYIRGYRLWRAVSLLPKPLRRLMACCLDRLPSHSLNVVESRAPSNLRDFNLADRIPKLSELLKQSSLQSLYLHLVSHLRRPTEVALQSREPETLLNCENEHPNLSDPFLEMMYLDMKTYLPDDILTKVDRASMAVGLEARVPLLDHRIVEFSWQLPLRYKFKNGHGKWLLRRLLDRYVPRQLMDRPKMGFGVPIEHWLRGPLRSWAEDLLDERRLQQEGYFDPGLVRKMWTEHCSGKRRWHYCLWDVLMFQSWLDNQSVLRS